MVRACNNRTEHIPICVAASPFATTLRNTRAPPKPSPHAPGGGTAFAQSCCSGKSEGGLRARHGVV
ncbi:hypothetical protein PLICRDRAFT_88819 [Plicaturopsis crispa FD-325 SS-3]|nr:hypothetical protein PLICRDRAFT_88819 [Plicaturopsis crispa FD-325 SS-3]